MARIIESYTGSSQKFGWKDTEGRPVTLTPKLSDMWFAEFHSADIRINGTDKIPDRFSAITNRVDGPSINTVSQELTQYGKRIQVPTAVTFGPVNLTFYDTVDGRGFEIASEIYNTYFKNNSLSTTTANLDSTIKDLNSGLKFRPQSDGALKEHHTFRKVSIYHFFGNNDVEEGAGGFLQKIDLINPLVTAIYFDPHDYANVQARNINISLQPENVIFGEAEENVRTPFWMKQSNHATRDEFETMNGNTRSRQQKRIDDEDLAMSEPVVTNKPYPDHIMRIARQQGIYPSLVPESRPAFDPKEINKKLIGASERVWEEFGGKDATGDRFRNQQDQLNAIQRIDDFINGIIRGL